MKRAIKTVLKVSLILVLLLVLIGVGISAFVSYVWGGNRLSPEEAMEAVGIGSSRRERIEAEGCCFYYETFADCYESCGDSDMSDCIRYVTPVVKTGFGMWHAITKPRKSLVYIDGTESEVGFFISHEVSGVYHNFFIPSDGGTNPPTFPDVLGEGCSSVTVNGEGTELFRHSYFVTETAVAQFEINGAKLVIVP